MRTVQTVGAAVAGALLALVVFGSRRRDDRQPTPLGIGSQSTGAGAGKVTINPFSISRLFKRAQTTDLRVGSQSTGVGAGKVTFNPFSIRRKSGGNDASGVLFVAAGVDDGARESA